MGREDEIRLIAYRIWEEEGCCHGRDIEHWLKAEAIWEEKQKKGPVSVNIKAQSKRTPERSKK
jgi:hypothetical protein